MVTLRSTGTASVHSHNVSASILIQVGLQELVADTEDDYIQIALDLAGVRARASAVYIYIYIYICISIIYIFFVVYYINICYICVYVCVCVYIYMYIFTLCGYFCFLVSVCLRAESRAADRNTHNAAGANAQVAAHGRGQGCTQGRRSLSDNVVKFCERG